MTVVSLERHRRFFYNNLILESRSLTSRMKKLRNSNEALPRTTSAFLGYFLVTEADDKTELFWPVPRRPRTHSLRKPTIARRLTWLVVQPN